MLPTSFVNTIKSGCAALFEGCRSLRCGEERGGWIKCDRGRKRKAHRCDGVIVSVGLLEVRWRSPPELRLGSRLEATLWRREQ